MKLRTAWMVLLLAAALSLAFPQHRDREKSRRLPSGKSQMEEILKHDHGKSLEDAAELVKLAEELQKELQKNSHNVLSVSTIKTTEEIEKLAKRIRSRLKRF